MRCRIPSIREETPWAGPASPGSIGRTSAGGRGPAGQRPGRSRAGRLDPARHRLRRLVAGRAGGAGHGRGGVGDPAGAGRHRHPARDGRRRWSWPCSGRRSSPTSPSRSVPGVTVDSFLAAFWATWIVAAVATLASWVMTAGTNDAVFAHLVRGARRGKPVADPEVTGILFVQLDGVPFPVLQWGVMGGTLPTLVAVDPQRQPRVHGVDPDAAGDDARQPDGDPARDDRRHPGLPLGRPRHGPGLRRQQAGRRGRHRGAALRRARAARRRRGVGEQPVQR